MILYKFLSAERAASVLQTNTIRFSQLVSLNDPFESYPQVEGFVTTEFLESFFEILMNNEELVRSTIETVYQSAYSNLNSDQKEELDYPTFKWFAEQALEEELKRRNMDLLGLVKATMNQYGDLIAQSIKEKLTDAVANNVCVLSLSATKSNPLMWAHYAFSHTGAVIGFDASNPFFSAATPVKYRSERPKIDFSMLPQNEDERLLFAKTLLGTKNTHWQHEEEYRIIAPLNTLKPTGKTDERGFPVFVAEFPTVSVKEIIFGCKIGPNSHSELSTICRQKYQNAIQFNALLDQKSESLVFKR